MAEGIDPGLLAGSWGGNYGAGTYSGGGLTGGYFPGGGELGMVQYLNPTILNLANQLGQSMVEFPGYQPFISDWTSMPNDIDVWDTLANYYAQPQFGWDLSTYIPAMVAQHALSNVDFEAWQEAGAPSMPSWMNWLGKAIGKAPAGTFGSGMIDVLLPALKAHINSQYYGMPESIASKAPLGALLGPYLGGVIQGVGGIQSLVQMLGGDVDTPIDQPLTPEGFQNLFGGGVQPGGYMTPGTGPGGTYPTLTEMLQPTVDAWKDIWSQSASGMGQSGAWDTVRDMAMVGQAQALQNYQNSFNPSLAPYNPAAGNPLYSPFGQSYGNSPAEQMVNAMGWQMGNPSLFNDLGKVWSDTSPGLVSSQYGPGSVFSQAMQIGQPYFSGIYGNDPMYQTAMNVALGGGVTGYPWIGSQWGGA